MTASYCRGGLTALALLALAVPAEAQPWQVARDQFAFGGRQLTVHVEAPAEGLLQVIRGPAGQVRVHGRVDAGIAAAGLSAREELTLTTTGAGPAEYVVTVPEGVRVTVRLPDRPLPEAMGNRTASRTFAWGQPTNDEAGSGSEPGAEPGAEEPGLPGRPVGTAASSAGMGASGAGYTVYTRPVAPELVDLPDLHRVRSVTVVIDDGAFRVLTGRPMAMQPGDEHHLEIRPADPALDIVLVVPAATARFSLGAGGHTALLIEAGRATALCTPIARDWLEGYRTSFTFAPSAGRLECAARGGDAATTALRLQT
jgi:hypothetical protein